MSVKHYSLSILVLTSILSSCSSWTSKTDRPYLNNVNLSEILILSTLTKCNQEKENIICKANSDVFIEKNKPSIERLCVFGGTDQDSVDIPYKKFKVLLSNSLPLKEEQMKEAFDLLKNGQVNKDINQTGPNLLKQITILPGQVLTDIPDIFRKPWDSTRIPGIHSIRETAIIFINPDNRTFRLAILAYARMNGVNIEEKNLNDLYNYLNKGNEENFDNLVKGGLETMKEQYGLTDIESAAKKFHAINQACMDKAREKKT